VVYKICPVTRVLLTLCTFPPHWVSLRQETMQAKIAIAFLWGQLHFNNVTSHALFYGGHLVMRSKRCAMQNQGITLRAEFPSFSLLVHIMDISLPNIYIWWLSAYIFVSISPNIAAIAHHVAWLNRKTVNWTWFPFRMQRVFIVIISQFRVFILLFVLP